MRFGLFHPCGLQQPIFLAVHSLPVEDRSFGLFVPKSVYCKIPHLLTDQLKSKYHALEGERMAACVGFTSDADPHLINSKTG